MLDWFDDGDEEEEKNEKGSKGKGKVDVEGDRIEE